MIMLTFSDACDLNQLSCGLCQLLPQFYAEPSLAEAPLGDCMHPSLKLPQFCFLGRHCFGKDPPCYLLQVINPSFSHSLDWWCLLAQHPSRGKPSFWKLRREHGYQRARCLLVLVYKAVYVQEFSGRLICMESIVFEATCHQPSLLSLTIIRPTPIVGEEEIFFYPSRFFWSKN